ncbi:hypothetical protein, partial [Salmonella enterica]|uniref:hypothetical protein n=1 Tax=Salmonella enterica TaxID=28901 RepID=UPI003D2E7AC1
FLATTGCKKDNAKPTDDASTTNTVIGGIISAFKDTTTVTEGSVTIQFSRTDACFPSNEIFEFKAVSTGFPATAKYVWDFGDG